jgi:cell wall assembly regulator SMI1
MNSPRESLRLIQGYLDRLGRQPTLERLQPGVEPEALNKKVEAVGLSAPADLAELYEWRNGTNASGAVLDDLHVWPGFYFLSVEDAIANYTAFVRDARWDRGWLPVFANGGGDFYAVVCHKGRGDWGQVIYFRIDEIEHPVEFHSIQALLATLAAAYESGIFFIDDRGYLEMNDVEFSELANSVDP